MGAFVNSPDDGSSLGTSDGPSEGISVAISKGISEIISDEGSADDDGSSIG